MERLTEKIYGSYDIKDRVSKTKWQSNEVYSVIQKLGELEDILESWYIRNLEELKTELHDCQVYHFKNNNYEIIIQGLENQLAELKRKAIIPKFGIGTKLYMIPTKFNGLKKIKDYELLSIDLSAIGVRYNLVVNKKENKIEQFYCASEDMFGESIFTTKEEAEQRFAQITKKYEE